jgi:cellulose synthase/poly-beta-1,6-N-acetylglucosamine synthase-like glycosyltransferase
MCAAEFSQLNSGGFSDVQLLTVILPAHNEAHVINETLVELTTALTGSYTPYEIIVVDDGSNDGTYQIASAYAKTRDAVPYSPAVVAYETANHYHAIVTLTSSAAQIL